MTSWSLVYEEFDPRKQALREALCTLGNGYFGTRGACAEASADDVHYPGTYLAGCYNRLDTEIAGRRVENEDLVNAPNWLPLTFRVADGEWFDLREVTILSYRQELDLRSGILIRRVRFRDRHDRVTVADERRLVHMYRPHVAALELVLTAENWSGRLQIRSALDGRLVNAGVKRYRQLENRHLVPLETWVEDDVIGLEVETTQSEVRIAEAARTRVYRDGELLGVERRDIEERGFVAQELTLDLAEQVPVTVEKVAAIYTSRDHAIAETRAEAIDAVATAQRFCGLLDWHAIAWSNLWDRVDLDIHETPENDGDRVAPILRLHIFHILQTASPNSMHQDVGVPARGLTGEAYRGHVFWDELFVFPFLNLRISEVTRALLMYRYRRLDRARRAAEEAGYRGAMYPWQSGSNGREETQTLHLNPKSGRWVPDISRLQRHVNSAIVYNVWQYYQVTGDDEFLSFYGAEMILEIARFWASIATYDEELGRYEILGVMGPDEYHDAYPGREDGGLDNNAYTNLTATWVLCRAFEVLELLPDDRRRELRAKLDLDDAELDAWDEISRKMRLCFHDDGILSQFEGYEKLAEFDWGGYREKYGDIQRLDRILEAEGDSPNNYKASKQADVLMLFFLFSTDELRELFERLGYEFDPEMIRHNIDYYLLRTSHGSTLSRVVHSWVLARSNRERSWELFTEALSSDVTDIQGGTTPEGIHLGAMAGTVDLVQRCYTGIELRGDTLWFNPCLPNGKLHLCLHLRFRGNPLEICVTHDSFKVTTPRSATQPIRIGLRDRVFELGPKEEREFHL